MPLPTGYFWNKAPFVRLLIALIAGIVSQWQHQFSISFLILLVPISIFIITVYFFIPLQSKFRLGYVNGIAINVLIALTGAILVWYHDIRHDKNWIGNGNSVNSSCVVTIEEPLIEKASSFKALASVDRLFSKGSFQKRKGQIVVYFKKDASLQQLHYGSQFVFNKPLQEIKNTGNPGSFDYERYSLFQGITHQVNLSANEFIILHAENKHGFRPFILYCRRWVVQSLQKSIHGKKEQGLAEALLIGYKDDLDKDLIQSYTNTGVVHIIAISGMHLALIYGLLVLVTRPIGKKRLRWLRTTVIVSGLWLFALLAGAEASVIRSAVMFTCIALAEVLSRRTSVFNTLALSAFLLLAYNPFWLWDVGFQLSYAAVVSIVIFYRNIYNWFYLPNKLLDFVWKTMAISLAAQILTTPISLYHFHQFPLLFLFTNLAAVPLSTAILFFEIAVCLLSWLPVVAELLGRLTEQFIYWMNSYIERLETVSFSLWKGFSVDILQTVLLLGAATGVCFWLMEKKKSMVWVFLSCWLLFTVFRSWSFAEAYTQKKLIIYNIPNYSAMDLIAGRRFNFVGDSAAELNDFIRNFHIRPSRVLYRIEPMQALPSRCRSFEFCKKRIVIINFAKRFSASKSKTVIDILVLSKNPKLYISNLLAAFSIQQVVIDSSVPQWKAKLWQHDCDSLKISCYNVSEKGAFVMNL